MNFPAAALEAPPDPAPAPLCPGEGRLAFARVDGASALVACGAATPLQLLAPRRRGASAWAVLASHGGGLVAGDAIALDVEVGPGAAALLSTQAETKVYRSAAGRGASQRLEARVAEGAALAVLPDAVSPFAGARYDQRQRFHLAPGASLLLLDAVVAGRTARGERWALDHHRALNEIHVDGRLALGDALLLAPRAPGELGARLGRFDAFALVVALGPAFAPCARALAAAADALPVGAGAPLLAAASPLDGGVLVRCAAIAPEALGAFVRATLAPAASALGAPLAHRW